MTFALDLSKSFAVSNPIPSEDPVTIINFPDKSFLIGFNGPFAHFIMKYPKTINIIRNIKRDKKVIYQFSDIINFFSRIN